MDKKMELWQELKDQMEKHLKSMTIADVHDTLLFGLPMIMVVINNGINDQVKMDAKVMFIKLIDKLDALGMKMLPDAPLRKDYDTYKAELGQKKDELVNSPLSKMFENLTFDQIMSTPIAAGLPNN